MGLPRWLSGKKSTCQCRRLKFNRLVVKILWKRQWQPIPIFLPGKSHRQRSLEGYSLRGHKESDTTGRLSMSTWYYPLYINTKTGMSLYLLSSICLWKAMSLYWYLWFHPLAQYAFWPPFSPIYSSYSAGGKLASQYTKLIYLFVQSQYTHKVITELLTYTYVTKKFTHQHNVCE